MKYDGHECAPEIRTPIFNRDGYYRLNKQCWFEYNGVARNYEIRSFDYSLALFNHKPLTKKEELALTILVKNKIADRKMKDLYFFDRDWKSIRETGRCSRKIFLHNLKGEDLIDD